MQLIALLSRCYPQPGFKYTKSTVDFVAKKVEVEIQPRKGSKPICSKCGVAGPCYDHLPQRRFDFVPFWGFVVFFLCSLRRVNCPTCGVTVEQIPWSFGKHHMTYAYVSFLSQWAKLLSWTDVAKSFHTTWDKVSYAVIAMVNYGLAHRSMTGISAIGIDEVQWKKGQNYLTVVYQINQGCRRLLWVGVDRTMASFEGFFRTIGPDVASKIEFACTDMWKPYLTLLKKHCPLALNVLDKFHIMAKINEAIDKTRRMETAKFKKAGLDLLHNLRWCVLKRPENLTAKQKKRLNGALHGNLTCNSQTIRAYVLAQMFQVFWTYSSPTWASKYLDKWTNTVMRSRIEPMKKVAKTIRTHKELILNYFKAKKEFSSGVVEGLNNNVKVAMRNARGYRSFAVAEAALYHRMGKLPEPHQFHAFY